MQALAEPLMDSSNTSKKQRGWSCPRFQGRVKGYVVALGAVLAVSPDGMLLRFIRANQPECVEEDDALVSCNIKMLIVLICIKYALMGTIQLAFVMWESGGPRKLFTAASISWRPLVAPSLFMLVTQFGFTIGLLETTAANAIMFFSLNPLWAALMGCVWLHDKVEKHTVIALVVSGTAVFGAFLPTALGLEGHTGVDPEGASHATLHGNAIALATGVSLAAFITSSRAGSLADGDAPMNVAPALGSLGAAALALPGALLVTGGRLPVTPGFLAYLLIDAVLEAGYDVGMSIAAQDITSAEVALVLLLEIPLGPLFVFIGFQEAPAVYTVIGCIVLAVTLVGHGVIEARAATAEVASRRSSHNGSLVASPDLATTTGLALGSRKNSFVSSPASLMAPRRTYSWNEDKFFLNDQGGDGADEP